MHTRRINLVFTSSRDAGSRVRSLENYFSSVFPYSIKLNRGRSSLDAVLKTSRRIGANYLCVIESNMGNPSALKLFALDTMELKYSFTVAGMSLSIDMKEIRPHHKYKGSCIENYDDNCQDPKWFLIDMGASILCRDDLVKIRLSKDGDNCVMRFNVDHRTILSLSLRSG